MPVNCPFLEAPNRASVYLCIPAMVPVCSTLRHISFSAVFSSLTLPPLKSKCMPKLSHLGSSCIIKIWLTAFQHLETAFCPFAFLLFRLKKAPHGAIAKAFSYHDWTNERYDLPTVSLSVKSSTTGTSPVIHEDAMGTLNASLTCTVPEAAPRQKQRRTSFCPAPVRIISVYWSDWILLIVSRVYNFGT